MRKLDRSRDFGKITPPLHQDDFDRPAYYTQDGALFDAHDREIIPGKPLTKEETADEKPAERTYTAAELIAGVDTMPWQVWRRAVKAILGETCPSGKVAMLEALKKAKAEYEARNANKVMSWGQQNPEPGEKKGIDLAAWARGQVDYLFADVRKEIRSRFHRVATTQANAIEILLDEGLVTADQARKAA